MAKHARPYELPTYSSIDTGRLFRVDGQRRGVVAADSRSQPLPQTDDERSRYMRRTQRLDDEGVLVDGWELEEPGMVSEEASAAARRYIAERTAAEAAFNEGFDDPEFAKFARRFAGVADIDTGEARTLVDGRLLESDVTDTELLPTVAVHERKVHEEAESIGRAALLSLGVRTVGTRRRSLHDTLLLDAVSI